MELRGKVALVTGAGVGTGRAIALALATNGCHVAVNYSRPATEAEATAAEIRLLRALALAVRAHLPDAAALRARVRRSAPGRARWPDRPSPCLGPIALPLPRTWRSRGMARSSPPWVEARPPSTTQVYRMGTIPIRYEQFAWASPQPLRTALRLSARHRHHNSCAAIAISTTQSTSRTQSAL